MDDNENPENPRRPKPTPRMEHAVLQELVSSPGWELIKNFLQGQIIACHASLENIDPNNISAVAAKQAAVKAMRQILLYPDSRINAIVNNLEKEA